MPIYDYACTKCDERFEELVTASGEQKVACPGCGSTKVERRYSSFTTKWKPSLVKWHRMPYG